LLKVIARLGPNANLPRPSATNVYQPAVLTFPFFSAFGFWCWVCFWCCLSSRPHQQQGHQRRRGRGMEGQLRRSEARTGARVARAPRGGVAGDMARNTLTVAPLRWLGLPLLLRGGGDALPGENGSERERSEAEWRERAGRGPGTEWAGRAASGRGRRAGRTTHATAVSWHVACWNPALPF